MPKNTTPHAMPTAHEKLLAAARRVVAARANPKLEWGQTKAMEEESFALDALAEAVAACGTVDEPVAETA